MVPGISGWLAADAEIPGVLENASEESGEKKAVKIQAGSVLYNRENLDTMAAKPMNCPNAMLTFKRKNRSYKELPIRYSEYDVLHRKEKSGQMNGLFRVQEFRQDDDHTFVAENQIEAEIADIISIADEVYSTFGVSYRAELSTRPDDFMGDIEVWNRAEAALKKILTDKYGEGGFEINEGDGAFYGPKIDLQIKDALGREWQCGTIQLDFQLPHNFGLSYQTAEGGTAMPVASTARFTVLWSALSASSSRTSRVFSRSGSRPRRSASCRFVRSTTSMQSVSLTFCRRTAYAPRRITPTGI